MRLRLNYVVFLVWIVAIAAVAFPPDTRASEPSFHGEPTSLIDFEKRLAALESLKPLNIDKYCLPFGPTFLDYHDKVVVEGKIDKAKVNSARFVNGLNQMISSYLHSGDTLMLEDILLTLSDAASGSAYLKTNSYTGGISGYNPKMEPKYHQAMILIPLGVIFPEIVRVLGSSADGVDAVRSWGDKLYESAISVDDVIPTLKGGVDLAGMKSAAYAVWGTATGQKNVLKQALKLFSLSTGSIGPGGEDTVWGTRMKYSGEKRRYYVNMTYGASVLTAEAFYRAGWDDVYTSDTGQSLIAGSKWLLDRIMGDPIGYAKHSEGTRSLAWMEVLITRFGDDPFFKQIDDKLSRASVGGIYNGQFGGHMTCLFRKVS